MLSRRFFFDTAHPATRSPLWWYSGDELVTLDGSSLVSDIGDRSGNANTLSQSNAARRPGLVSVNGKNALLFTYDAFDPERLFRAALAQGSHNGAKTLYFVVRNRKTTEGHIAAMGSIGQPGIYLAATRSQSGQAEPYSYAQDFGAYLTGGSGSLSGAVLSDTRSPAVFVVCVVMNGASSAIYIDRLGHPSVYADAMTTPTVSGTLNNPGAMTGIILGDSDFTSPADADLCEAICIPGADSQAQRAAMRDYLVDRWIGFTPAMLSNVALWLRKDDGIGPGDTTPWNDVSGNGRHFSQSTSSLKPTWDATNKVLDFDSSDDEMVCTAFNQQWPCYLYMVVYCKGTTVTPKVAMFRSQTTAYGPGPYIGNFNVARGVDIYDAGSSAFALGASAPNAPLNTWSVVRFRIENNGSQFTYGCRVDRNTEVVTTKTGTVTTQWTKLSSGSGVVQPINAKIAEVLMVQGAALSTANDTSILNYFTARHGTP